MKFQKSVDFMRFCKIFYRFLIIKAQSKCAFFIDRIVVSHVGAIPESPASQKQVYWPSGFTGDPGIAPTKTCQ